MRKALTAALIQSVKAPKAGRLEIADMRCSGLSFRVTSAGARSWCFRFRDPATGATTRATIGTFPAVLLGAARSKAEAMRADVAAGINPVTRKREAKATAGEQTFKHLAERYMIEHAARHKKASSAAEDRRNLDLHILPKWGKRSFVSVRRADVIELIEGLIADGKPTTGNRVQALTSKIFSFGIDAGMDVANPCHRLKKRGVETEGQRVLSDGELRLFWWGIVEPAAARQTGLALRLALLTGVRRSEAAGICRTELAELDNPTDALWVIPGARTKNGRTHSVPLAPLARETVLAMLALIDSAEPFLLPTQSNKRTGPMEGETLTKAMAYFSDRVSSMQNSDAAVTWTAEPPSPHDLRRTLETRMAALGIAKEYRDHVLNHVQGDVGAKHYDRHSYLPEKRSALTRWNDALGTILQMPIEGAAVIPLARSRVTGG
jgi:integrase